jgi:hypothetical protein
VQTQKSSYIYILYQYVPAVSTVFYAHGNFDAGEQRLYVTVAIKHSALRNMAGDTYIRNSFSGTCGLFSRLIK